MPNSNINLGQAMDAFMQSPHFCITMKTSLNRFITLCGRKCPLFTLTDSEVSHFAKEVKRAPERKQRVEALSSFFEFAKSNGWIRTNPAAKIGKRKTASATASKTTQTANSKPARDAVLLSTEGLQTLQARLETLRQEKERVTEEVKDAREEGDLKENAGYHDARERLGLIDGQIREHEDMIKRAVVMD